MSTKSARSRRPLVLSASEFGQQQQEPADSHASPPSVVLSRHRCARQQLDSARAMPLHGDESGPVDGSTLFPYLSLVRPVLEDLYQFVEGAECALGVVDGEARLLDTIGDRDFAEELRPLGFEVGSVWSEECTGTNAFALALTEAFPVQVHGAEHYASALSPYCTSAAPVYDSLGGLVGALVAITRASRAQPYTLAMLNAAAGTLSHELTMHLWLGSANELFSELRAILQSLTDGVLLLQPDGTIKQMNAKAGHVLGLVPARVAGHKLHEVIDVPPSLASALAAGREVHDEEVVFRVDGERVACLCSLRSISTSISTSAPFLPLAMAPALAKSAPTAGADHFAPSQTSHLRVEPQSTVGGFVLMLRTIERVQRLVHRISGAEARMRFDNIVGQSPTLLEAVRLGHIAAENGSTVLLHGETGTGKEIFAQSIHNGSQRAAGPFVAINCAAIPRELIISELFGYEAGAFTGADRQGRPGKFELAHRGTLFLDEIGDMPQDLQTSLLRAIETHSITRVGGQSVIPVDVRIIAATHRDLNEAVRLGHFRSDLYFRLNVFPIEVPALRARPGDVPLLLRYILQRLSTRLHHPLGVDGEALAALVAYHWPGNVRELENVIERAVYLSESGIVTLRELPDEICSAIPQRPAAGAWIQYGGLGAAPRASQSTVDAVAAPAAPRNLRQESEHLEADLLKRTLAACEGNTTRAARMLGIDRTTLWRKRVRYHL